MPAPALLRTLSRLLDAAAVWLPLALPLHFPDLDPHTPAHVGAGCKVAAALLASVADLFPAPSTDPTPPSPVEGPARR